MQMNNKWGFINEEGALIIACKYDWIPEKQNASNIFINKQGARFDKDFTYCEGRLIKVGLNKQAGFIDIEGNEYWEN